MASRKRHSCKGYAGVFYVEAPRPKGSDLEKVYYIRYRRAGKLVEEKAGHQYRDAMTPAKAAGIRAARIEGRQASNTKRREVERAARAEKDGKITIGKLWEMYAEANAEKPSMRTDRYTYKHIAGFCDKSPLEIETSEIDGLRKRLSEEGKAAQTVKHALGLLRRIIHFGVQRDFCEMPLRLHFTMPKVDNVKTECLTPEQGKALLAALDEEVDQNLASLVRLALATGIRRGALLALQWVDVDFRQGNITLRGENAKKGKTEHVPMSAQARAILEGVRRGLSPYVFPSKTGGKRVEIRRLLERVKCKAGLPEDFRPLHGLRHTYASWLASSGKVDLYTLQKLLTHESPQMTQRYAHLADEAMRRAAAVADECFAMAVNAELPEPEKETPKPVKVIPFRSRKKAD